MHCGRNDGTTVAAHSNQSRDGKGMGIKAHDYRVAYLCQECHSWLDHGRGSRDEKVAMFEEAHRKTVAYWFESGIVTAQK